MSGGSAHQVADLRRQIARLRTQLEAASKVVLDQREQIERLVDANHRLAESAPPETGQIERLRDQLFQSQKREHDLHELCVGLAAYIGELARDFDDNCNEEMNEVLHDLDRVIAKTKMATP